VAVIGTTKLSSKGQVVIPEEVRKALGLEAGAQFVVTAQDDLVILKRIVPAEVDFAALLARLRTHARKAGLKRSDVKKATAAVRRGE
jgi:AbrB family looped-hinge helix DNA binding protein